MFQLERQYKLVKILYTTNEERYWHITVKHSIATLSVVP